ncbi:MAG: YdeI/OmpD-associated family protein [Bacteroidota bacterium]|nr:YdeI/OmpD-associated family protein [Bacteroidota bacterium]
MKKEIPVTNTVFPIVSFATPKQWERWLSKNHSKLNGIWLQFYKKDSGVKSVNRAEALDAALCYGWIDGQSKKLDEKSWINKFTPRRSKSIWSKINREHVERLIKSCNMTDAGLKQVEAAKADGRWERAYDSPSSMKIPDDFLKELSKYKRAKTFFETLNKANIYAIGWRLQTAKKEETRERWKKKILDMLKKGEKFHG